MSHSFSAPTLEVIPHGQRVFCKCRQLFLNIVDLDIVLNLKFSDSKSDPVTFPTNRIRCVPATVLYNFCNVCPTVAPVAVLVLSALRVPANVRNIVSAPLHLNTGSFCRGR